MAFENAYALLIGTASDDKITATRNDAEELFNILRTDALYPHIQTELLTRNNATKAEIVKAFERLSMQAHMDATVFIYFAGHGRPPKEGTCNEYHLLPQGYKDGNPNSVISRTEFREMIRSFPSKKKVIFLNCCHAGGASSHTLSDEVAYEGINHKLVDQLDAGAGSVIISACSADEKSHILKGATYTIFGQHLIDALRGAGSDNDVVHLREVFDYVRHKVKESAKAINAEQSPSISSSQEENFPLSFNTYKIVQRKQVPHILEPATDPLPAFEVLIKEQTAAVPAAAGMAAMESALEKANNLSSQYRIRKHSQLIQSIKRELGKNLFNALPDSQQTQIRDHLDGEGPRGDLLLAFEGDNRKLPWELMSIELGESFTVPLSDHLGISRKVEPLVKPWRKEPDTFRVLLIDTTEEQEFYHLFDKEFTQTKPFTKYFTVLGRDDKSRADFNSVKMLVQNLKPSIIHYIGNIDQGREQSKLFFPDQSDQLVPALAEDALKQGHYDWLFQIVGITKRIPIPSLFIVQDWATQGSAEPGAIEEFENAVRFFARCGISGSCFLPFSAEIDAASYINYVYHFGNDIGLQALNRNPSRNGLRLSLLQNLRHLIKERKDSLQFVPVVYQSTTTPLDFVIRQRDERVSGGSNAHSAGLFNTEELPPRKSSSTPADKSKIGPVKSF